METSWQKHFSPKHARDHSSSSKPHYGPDQAKSLIYRLRRKATSNGHAPRDSSLGSNRSRPLTCLLGTDGFICRRSVQSVFNIIKVATEVSRLRLKALRFAEDLSKRRLIYLHVLERLSQSSMMDRMTPVGYAVFIIRPVSCGNVRSRSSKISHLVLKLFS